MSLETSGSSSLWMLSSRRGVYATLTNVTNQLVDDGFTADLGFANGVHMLVEVGTSNFIGCPGSRVPWTPAGRYRPACPLP